MPLTDVYRGQATDWARGAERVYLPLAHHLVASSPSALRGLTALDVGSGTGAVASAAAATGARVVTVDRSPEMAAVTAGHWPATTADTAALPFRDRSFDVALAGFVLNHLEPSAALREMARVLRGGGVLVATTWEQRSDPVKEAIDRVLRDFGWVPPDWHREMMQDILPISGNPSRLAGEARCAGFHEVRVRVSTPSLGPQDPASVVGYRMALPHVGPWLAALGDDLAAEVCHTARAAVRDQTTTWRPRVIVLSGHAAGQTKRSAKRSNALR